MPNPCKRGQAVKYEIAGRTGNITRGSGTFKAMGTRGRCVIKLENGKEATPFVSKVQAFDAAPPEPKARRGADKNSTGRGAAKREVSRRTSAAAKPARRTGPRAAKADYGEQLATINEKLDRILAALARADTPDDTTAENGYTPFATPEPEPEKGMEKRKDKYKYKEKAEEQDVGEDIF